jgi:hypothetical protein
MAETTLLDVLIRKIAPNHVRSGRCVPSIGVPFSTLNCARHPKQYQ